METGMKIFGMLLLGLAVSFIQALFVMWLWNWIVPSITHFTEISFWEAFGLRVLFGSLTYNYEHAKTTT